MSPVHRRVASIGLLFFAAACGDNKSITSAPDDESIAGPTPPVVGTAPRPGSPATSPPTAAGVFPAPTGPSRVFAFHGALEYAVQPYTVASRFVLYDNGAFALQYGGVGKYLGRYTETNGRIEFVWEGWSTAGAWGATGTLSSNTLVVRYNMIMMMTDFEDAVYVR